MAISSRLEWPFPEDKNGHSNNHPIFCNEIVKFSARLHHIIYIEYSQSSSSATSDSERSILVARSSSYSKQAVLAK